LTISEEEKICVTIMLDMKASSFSEASVTLCQATLCHVRHMTTFWSLYLQSFVVQYLPLHTKVSLTLQPAIW